MIISYLKIPAIKEIDLIENIIKESSIFCNIEHCVNCIHYNEGRSYHECWCSKIKNQTRYFSDICNCFKNKNRRTQ